MFHRIGRKLISSSCLVYLNTSTKMAKYVMPLFVLKNTRKRMLLNQASGPSTPVFCLIQWPAGYPEDPTMGQIKQDLPRMLLSSTDNQRFTTSKWGGSLSSCFLLVGIKTYHGQRSKPLDMCQKIITTPGIMCLPLPLPQNMML